MTDTAIIDKLRKVLALTTSPIEGEATAAAETLARLLTSHNLDIADLEQRGAQAATIEEQPHDLGKAAYAWKLNLAEAIAEHYYCHGLVDRTTKRVAFIGRPDNVGSLRLLYAWLIGQIALIAREERRREGNTHIDPLRWQVGFGEGAVERLADRLRELKRRREQSEAGAATCALVVHHAVEVSDYLEQRYGYRADGRRTAESERWHREWEERKARLAELKLRDIEAYYAECPWMRPLTEAEQAERDKRDAQDRKRQARNERRRKGRGGHHLSNAEYVKLEQKRSAISSGRTSADRINLEPFLGTGRTSRGEIEQ
jgi:hypothetical protein